LKEPFDPVKACFYLVAGVIAVHLLIVVVGAIACLMYANELIATNKTCPSAGNLSEILGAALAAALAFAGGKNSGK